MKVKLLEKIEKVLAQVAKEKGVSKQHVLETIKKNFQDDLFLYGLNVKIDRASALGKNSTEVEKQEKRFLMTEALFNGQWSMVNKIDRATLEKNAKISLIKELEGQVDEETLKLLKQKAGI